AGELHLLLERVDLGARWRDELRDMAERLRLGDLRRSVMAMTRTESLGTPLAESLRRRADEVREARRAAAAERARKAPVKMLFPLVFMILPAFLLLTVVPVLLSTLRSVR
ncbi:MAG TPA: type II secretion system F family protein, partial [Actinomycetota bacterium]